MPELPLTDESFREVAARYATGVVVVTTQADGFDHAMTATSFSTVSLNPMLVLVCVSRTPDSTTHCAETTLRLVRVGASAFFPKPQPRLQRVRNQGAPLLYGQLIGSHFRGEKTGMILMSGALASMEVLTTKFFPVGDHTIVVGEVQSWPSGRNWSIGLRPTSTAGRWHIGRGDTGVSTVSGHTMRAATPC